MRDWNGKSLNNNKKKNLVNLHQTTGYTMIRCFLTALKRQDYSHSSFREGQEEEFYTMLNYTTI